MHLESDIVKTVFLSGMDEEETQNNITSGGYKQMPGITGHHHPKPPEIS